jgi:glucokinase
MKLIGVDLGGTKISAALIAGDRIIRQDSRATPADRGGLVVVNAIADSIATVFDEEVAGIGIGVPGLIDLRNNLVIDVNNIPGWREVPLKRLLEERFRKPVFVNNDANCFALGEKFFGRGQAYRNFVGLTLGTGLGAGIIINDHLYAGNFGGAGEFGMLYYRDADVEHYASGQFFKRLGLSGDEMAGKAAAGDPAALNLFQELGTHIGRAVANILYALAPEAIIMGGSVSRSYPYFEAGMRAVLEREFAFRRIYEALRMEVSDMENSALLGAGSLVLDAATG